MARIFRRKPQETPEIGPAEPLDPENREGAHLERYYSRWVPASVRTPDAMRIGLPALEETDGPDDDVEFIASLLEQVERTPAPIQKVTLAPEPRIERIRMPEEPAPRRETERPAPRDDMQFFREMKDDRDHPSPIQMLKVADVEMADLLETLETTAAALRRRKAA